MEQDPSLKIKKSIEESIRIKNLIIKKETYKVLEEIRDLMVSSIKDRGKIMLCSNGGGICLPFFNLSFVVPSDKTARIQDAYIMGGHVLIEYIEAKLIKDGFLNLS
tara:strand:+ start:2436 stop:2753 length:318 start_codon:yes stop_codon:yes gene_type:complete